MARAQARRLHVFAVQAESLRPDIFATKTVFAGKYDRRSIA